MNGEWDYIIVGAGSAGCVLAERLSADGHNRILLLEEGEEDRGWLFAMPKGLGRMPQSRQHVYRTEFDRGADAPPEIWKRGKVLGGSSAINGMVWVRCQREDFDALAEAGNPGWSWDDMLPHFRALEDHQLGESATRGSGGPVQIAAHARKTRLADAFIRSIALTGVPERSDLNDAADQTGVGYSQANISRNGQRQSASATFLRLARRRRNLRIETGVRVDRVLFEGLRATGVEGMKGSTRIRYGARAEVILCAGAIVSPRILQLSGIGPGDRLRALGLEVLVNSPGVGENACEHFVLPIQYRLRHDHDSANREYAGIRLYQNALAWFLFGKGIMAESVATAAAFLRCMPGATRADAELLLSPYSIDLQRGTFLHQPGLSIYGSVLRPQSRGHVRLTSPDPLAPPAIQPNYLAEVHDQAVAVAMVRKIRHIMSLVPLADLVEGEIAPSVAAESDEEILTMFRRWANPGYHTTGTCAMGQGAAAVTDEKLRVRGVSNLRVVDCSIFPDMLSGNTNAPVMAAASRAAAFITLRS